MAIVAQNPPDSTRDVFARWGNTWHTAFFSDGWQIYNRFQTIPTPPDQWIEIDALNATETDDAGFKTILNRLNELYVREARQHVQIEALNARAEIYDEELKAQRDRLDAQARLIRVLMDERPAAPTRIGAVDANLGQQVQDLVAYLETRPAPPEPALTVQDMRNRINEWWAATRPRVRSIQSRYWLVADPDLSWQASGIADSMDNAIRAAYAALVARFPEVAQ